MLTNKELAIMDLLRREAILTTPVRSSKIAAAVVIKNKIISIGRCQMKTHPMQMEFGKNDQAIYLHAEMDVIIKGLQFVDVSDYNNASIMICRVKRPEANNKIWIYGNAKPCVGRNKLGCMNAILHFGFKRVIYTQDDGTFYKEKLR